MIKSDLQQRLESEGWEFLTNIDRWENEQKGLEIKGKYEERGYRSFKITEAYDTYGKPLLDMVGCYGKK